MNSRRIKQLGFFSECADAAAAVVARGTENRFGRLRYAGVLPFAHRLTDGEMVFLLGREANDHTWCPFGGGIEKSDASLEAAALREMYEESMGFLGCDPEKTHSGGDGSADKCIARLMNFYSDETGATFLMRVPFDERLPQYYGRSYAYAVRCKKCAPEEGYLEKDAIRWFTRDELKLAAMTAKRRKNHSTLQGFLLREDFVRLLRTVDLPLQKK